MELHLFVAFYLLLVDAPALSQKEDVSDIKWLTKYSRLNVTVNNLRHVTSELVDEEMTGTEKHKDSVTSFLKQDNNPSSDVLRGIQTVVVNLSDTEFFTEMQLWEDETHRYEAVTDAYFHDFDTEIRIQKDTGNNDFYDIKINSLDLHPYFGNVYDTQKRLKGTFRAIVENNILVAKITMDGDLIYIEPAKGYCEANENMNCSNFNAIAYNVRDIRVTDKLESECRDDVHCKQLFGNDMYIAKNLPLGHSPSEIYQNNIPRACKLEIITDYTIYKSFDQNFRMIVLMLRHIISEASELLRKKDFSGDKIMDNIRLSPSLFTVFTKNDSLKVHSKLNREFDTESGNITEYVQWLRYYPSHEKSCFRILFTSRDFDGPYFKGPWINENDRRRVIRQQGNNEAEENQCWDNVAVVSLQKDGVPFPRSVLIYTLVHLLSHWFGARHDEQPNCMPQGSKPGNYLMSIVPVDGSKHTFGNHDEFSKCSIDDINSTLNTGVLDSYFIDERDLTCGNFLKEQWEECDCMSHRKRCTPTVSPCCLSKKDNDVFWGYDEDCVFRYLENNEKDITSKCGSEQPPRDDGITRHCCGENCAFLPKGVACYPVIDASIPEKDRDCLLNLSWCPGNDMKCPVRHVDDGTPCNDVLNTCKNGSCKSTICLDHNAMDCICPEEDDRCEACCLDDKNLCKTASSFGYYLPKGKKALKPQGTECSETGHVCDGGGKCVGYTTTTTAKPTNPVTTNEESPIEMAHIDEGERDFVYRLGAPSIENKLVLPSQDAKERGVEFALKRCRLAEEGLLIE